MKLLASGTNGCPGLLEKRDNDPGIYLASGRHQAILRTLEQLEAELVD